MRRELEGFELAQIWITDKTIAPLDEQQRARMQEQFGTIAIPLHVIIDPETGAELARFKYRAPLSDSDYVEFLKKGLAAYREAHPPAPTAPPSAD